MFVMSAAALFLEAYIILRTALTICGAGPVLERAINGIIRIKSACFAGKALFLRKERHQFKVFRRL